MIQLKSTPAAATTTAAAATTTTATTNGIMIDGIKIHQNLFKNDSI